MTEPPFRVRIWGARGSAPAPAAPNCHFGADTSCVEMRCGDRVLIFDAGSGIMSLGTELVREGVRDFDLYFTHCHFDHIIGLPFLKPLYDPAVTARIHAGHFQDGMTCREMAERFMGPPWFPLTPKQFRAAIEFRDFRPPDRLDPAPGIGISTVRLHHPNSAVGYRVDFAGRSVCYITDTEHIPGELDGDLLDLIRGADMMIYDCMYTDAEFECCIGFGHSTWEQGVRLCEAAGVGRLVIYHHRPGRDDTDLRQIEAEAKARFAGAIMAGTGLELSV
jgi:phosphoribosyl 1,2-cyclic phosphodiesterase